MPPVTGCGGMHGHPAKMLRYPTWIGCDLFGAAFGHHAPADARLGVPTIYFKCDRCLGHRIQLGTRTGPEHDNPAIHAVVDRENLDLAPEVKRDPAHLARPEEGKTFVLCQNLRRIVECHVLSMPPANIRRVPFDSIRRIDRSAGWAAEREVQ